MCGRENDFILVIYLPCSVDECDDAALEELCEAGSVFFFLCVCG